MVEIQYGVVHAPCIKRNGNDGHVMIGCGVVFLARSWRWLLMVCGWWLLLVGAMRSRVKNLSSVGWVCVAGVGGYYVAWYMGRGRP